MKLLMETLKVIKQENWSHAATQEKNPSITLD